MTEQVEAALTDIREILQLDGADLRVDSVGDAELELALILDGVECLECVVPRASIEAMVLVEVRKALPALSRVVIHDPRESELSEGMER